MDSDLRTILDAASGLLDDAQRELTKLDAVMSALYEQAEDDPADDEVPGMLRDATTFTNEVRGSMLAFRDYLGEITRELL